MSVLTRFRRSSEPADTQNQRPGLGGALAGTVDSDPGRDQGGASRSIAATLDAGGTATARVLTRASSGALMVALVCGPAALAWQAFTPQPAPVRASTSSDDTLRLLSRRAVASEAATAWVSAWLSATEATSDVVRAAYPHLSADLKFPREASQVADARVVDAVASAPGVWTVTVSAAVTPAGQDAASTRYFRVPVAVDGETGDVAAHPMAQPAVIAGPVNSDARDTLAYTVSVAASSTVGDAVTAGLDAMLTGRGDLARYVTPGVLLRPLEAPYSTVRVVEIRADLRAPGVADDAAPADGQVLRVLVTVHLADGETRVDQGQSAVYPLTLTARGGRWEITGIDTSPLTTTTATPATPTTAPTK